MKFVQTCQNKFNCTKPSHSEWEETHPYHRWFRTQKVPHQVGDSSSHLQPCQTQAHRFASFEEDRGPGARPKGRLTGWVQDNVGSPQATIEHQETLNVYEMLMFDTIGQHRAGGHSASISKTPPINSLTLPKRRNPKQTISLQPHSSNPSKGGPRRSTRQSTNCLFMFVYWF